MAAPAHNAGGSSNHANAMSPDTLITIKITVNDVMKKMKLPLRDLSAAVLPGKLRQILSISPEEQVVFERFSDSAGGFITLDPNNPQVFKTLIRAAKAKLKLRLKATTPGPTIAASTKEQERVKPAKIATSAMEPTISNSRDSTALDQRSVGTGIFQFREARASQQTLINEEAPVPRPFESTKTDLPTQVKSTTMPAELAFRSRAPAESFTTLGHAWSVYCNECDRSMTDAHFHCSICDGGDYDLCEECVANGKLCPGEGHWLIKRFIKDGKVINSTTERISPRNAQPDTEPMVPELPAKSVMPGAFGTEIKTLAENGPTRTCNNCVVVLPERDFVTCTVCDDFDLCIKCHIVDKHGHHPAHGFNPATKDTVLPLAAESKLAPGRNTRHNAICDGCDKKIYGVRHKCLNCPDWDYCNECIMEARQSHPRHRFAALYQPIADQYPSMVRHHGIYCDGPLCSKKPDQTYIQGVRYKCAICHDTDFCAACEALPSNHHNRTHPLIKLKTPVRDVNVSTSNEDLLGNVRVVGDRRPDTECAQANNAVAVTSTQPANAASRVQTVADIKPTEVKKETEKSAAIDVIGATVPKSQPPVLNAHFVRDSVKDGTTFKPDNRFTQIWTLKNPGPQPWPAGCSVRFVGGDNMLNVDNHHPASVSTINDAIESNVIGREVQTGEEVAFKVVLKAPIREGKSISYWRLKAADGTPFGHRLWCDIEVKQPEQTPAETQRAGEHLPTSEMRENEMIRQQQALIEQRILQGSKVAPKLLSLPPEQPPAYDNTNLSVRFAAMRDQQKARRQQMMAQFMAQRDQLQARGIRREDMPSWAQHANPAMGNKATESLAEKERREAVKQRVAHIKANILKAREENEKLQVAADQTKAREDERKREAFRERAKRVVAATAQRVENEKEAIELTKAEAETIAKSQMVFPKLEKESPSSSVSQLATTSSDKGKAAYVENEQGEVEHSAVSAAEHASSPSDDEDFEELDDIEVLSANDEDSEDDGFLTDEEYDILDASDQETVTSK